MKVKTIDAGDFTKQCPELLDQLDFEGLVITKHGKPVARVLPYESGDSDLIGSLRQRIEVKGEIFSTHLNWDAAAQSQS